MSLTRWSDRAGIAKLVTVMLVLFLIASGLALTSSAQDPPVLFLRAKATPDVRIDLAWEITNDTGVARYDIYWDTDEIGDISGRTPDASTTDAEYTVSGLRRQTMYHFMVAAVDSDGRVLAIGYDNNTPGKYADIGDLKEVNYWAIMGFAGVILVLYLIALWRIPAWVQEEKAMEERESGVA